MTHIYEIGQSVVFTPAVRGQHVDGAYKIIQVLPAGVDSRKHYRIKSADEAFERVAEESQLANSP